ncbi:MAG: hypothetical protein OES32_07145 [Acidobacteriota bacterium]|nr:hypothetical protein [Acidobacteriota bacterium]MDH3523347.1 hypothetical protein [Acidobacteriota bacterium]
MPSPFSRQVIFWLFLLGGLMFGLGWALLPVKIGTFLEPGDFAAVHAVMRPWIWIFRVHIFGFVTAVMALVALGSVLRDEEVRALAWPGIAIAAAGLVVGALSAAFYYHHGAWGALATAGFSPAELRAHVDSLATDTEYVTCLVRFARVFVGLGQVVLALGLLRGGVLPRWVSYGAILLGLAAMALTMGLPDDLELYAPVFYLDCAWLAGVGFAARRAESWPASGLLGPAAASGERGAR